MAVLTILEKSPHTIRYGVTSNSSLDTMIRALATVAADCDPGPLKNYLESLSPASFDDNNPDLDLDCYTNFAALPASCAIGKLQAGAINMSASGGALAAGVYDLVLRHSIDR